MPSFQGVCAPQSKGICALPAVRPSSRSFPAGNYMSPVRTIPVEVVSNIFDIASQSSHDPISQSISVSHVCRRWREIALSVPSLWTSIVLSLPLSKSQFTRMITWIIRSRNRPLDIHMDFRDPSWDWDEASHIFGSKAMGNIMCILVPYASRWRSVELFTDTWAPIFTFLSCTVAIESVPNLKTIRLARCNEYFVARGVTFAPTHLALPVAWFRGGAGLHLRHVSLSGVHVDWAQSGLMGLQELELRYHARDVMPTVSEFLRILSANKGLQRLVILGWGPRMDSTLEYERESVSWNKDLRKIDLPQLEELELGFVDVACAVELLSMFSLPSLRALSIEDVAFGIQFSGRQDCSRLFVRLVEMSSSKEQQSPYIPLSLLHTFSLRNVHADATSIRGLFTRLSTMTSLCLNRVEATSVLAACSALDACERLQILTLKDVDPAATALVLTTNSFPARLRIFLDVEDADEDDGEHR